MKIWNWLRVALTACGIFWGELESLWMINKKTTWFRGSLFWPCYLQWVLYALWIHTCNDLRFFQNFQGKPRNFIGVFTKAFPQPPCLFFAFFWNRPLIDTFSVLGANLPCLLHWSRTSSWTPKQNLLHVASQTYVPLLFPNNLLACNLVVFILTK